MKKNTKIILSFIFILVLNFFINYSLLFSGNILIYNLGACVFACVSALLFFRINPEILSLEKR